MTKKLEDILNLPNVKEAFKQVDAKEKAKESKEVAKPEDADMMRRAVQSLTVPRQTINPDAILKLLTMVIPE